MTMTAYELAFHKEILMEIGAGVLGDLFRYAMANGIDGDDAHPVNILYDLLWNAKQDIPIAKAEAELQQIEGQFKLGKKFLEKMETP